MAEEIGRDLTGRQLAFIDAWFGEAQFNATEAARIAGYGNGSGNANTWASYGSQTLSNLKVLAEVKRRWSAHGVTSDEVMSRLAAQMRGSISDLLCEEVDALTVDPKKVREHGYLVKALRPTKDGMVVELYSAQEAAKLIGQTLGMFKERVELTGKDGAPIQTIHEVHVILSHEPDQPVER